MNGLLVCVTCPRIKITNTKIMARAKLLSPLLELFNCYYLGQLPRSLFLVLRFQRFKTCRYDCDLCYIIDF